MLRRQREMRSHLLRLVDACLFAVAFYLAWWLRSSGLLGPLVLKVLGWFGGTPEIEPFELYLPIMLLTIPFSLVLLQSEGFYNRSLLTSRLRTVWSLLKVITFLTIGIIVAMWLTRVVLSRAVIILFGVISFVVIMGKEELLRLYFLTTLGPGQLRKRMILFGTREDAKGVRAEIAAHDAQDIDIIAELDVNETTIEEAVELMHQHSINGVIMASKHAYFGQVERIIQACELEGIEVWMFADFFNTQISRTSLDELYGRPMVVFRSAPEVSWQGVAKQLVDFLGALVSLVVFSPLLLFCAAAIRLSSPGPVLFRQQRSGLNGRPFTMYKFRTMATDAEQRKVELEALNEMSGPVFKVAEDPRVTPIGRFLRGRSFDELPQLVNVLRGEMSLVGPRPLPVDETMRFDDLAHRRRLSVKPGLTCLWQIRGRNQVTDFKEWVRLDLEYIDNWSLWLDFKILLRTIPVVLLGTGAK